jgi:hypothetical protein
MLPAADDGDQENGFFFSTLAIPKFEMDGGYEGYRVLRRKFLEIYAYSLLEKNRNLKRIVGIATEPRNRLGGGGSSEDMIVVEPGTWTPESIAQLEKTKKAFNIDQEENVKTYSVHQDEFPEVILPPLAEPEIHRPNRHQRRAAGAKARKRT